MKIFTSTQIHDLDKYTIEYEPISSINLMERASQTITEHIVKRWDNETEVVVFAGPGNNGGDALAVARMLMERGYSVSVYLFNVKGTLSEDCDENLQRLKAIDATVVHEVTQEFEPPKLREGMLVVDGLFGSGLNKPLAGGFAAVVKYINQSSATVVSIDLPSGLMSEANTYNVRANIIKADVTLTLGQKKLCMMFGDTQQYVGEVEVLDIGLSKEYIDNTDAAWSIVEAADVTKKMLQLKRGDFAHKGSMGHALLVAGSYGMAGAAVLATKACLRSGVGKCTIHTPRKNNDILQISVPEAIVHVDRDDESFLTPVDLSGKEYDALGIGPGLGHAEVSAQAMMSQMRNATIPMVADADALNVIATHRTWQQQLPEGVIYTPHPKEMERLSDAATTDDYDRMMKASELAQRLKGYVLLKGHYSALCMPDGHVVFNSTGNSGMATAGAGDVLTGIITALLARGYDRANAAIVGMYLHGLAGDMAASEKGVESLVASDIVEALPKAMKVLLGRNF